MNTRTKPRPISTAPRNGDAVLLLLPEEPPWNDAGPHENRFVVAYWMTAEDGSKDRWQALAGGMAVSDFYGSFIGYDDDDVEGWYPLPSSD